MAGIGSPGLSLDLTGISNFFNPDPDASRASGVSASDSKPVITEAGPQDGPLLGAPRPGTPHPCSGFNPVFALFHGGSVVGGKAPDPYSVLADPAELGGEPSSPQTIQAPLAGRVPGALVTPMVSAVFAIGGGREVAQPPVSPLRAASAAPQ